MGIRSYITVAQLSAAKKNAPIARMRMKKAAAFDPQPKARVKPMTAGEPAIGTIRRVVRTQAMQTDDMRDRGNTKDKADFSYKPKPYQSRYGKGQTDEVDSKGTYLATNLNAGKPGQSANLGYTQPCHRCGKGFPKYGQGAPHEQMVRLASPKGAPIHVGCRKGPSTNPAAVKQIEGARANTMGNLDKAGPEVVHECPHCGELSSKGCEHAPSAHADQTDIAAKDA